MRVRAAGRLTLVVAAVAVSVAMAAPASASVATGKKTPPPVEPAGVTEVSMEWNCDELTEADRQKALREGVRMCGLNEPASGGVTTFGANNNNCGTAYIYVGQAGGRARVDYSLHSTMGIITYRHLNVWWGPTYSGSKVDLGWWQGTAFYGTQQNIGYAMNNKKFGASMNGYVNIFGWTVGCTVYATEPVRTL